MPHQNHIQLPFSSVFHPFSPLRSAINCQTTTIFPIFTRHPQHEETQVAENDHASRDDHKLQVKPTGGGDEVTFRSFSVEQGINYAEHRSDYHPSLYKIIFDHHRDTGGKFYTILDVGCGPGIVTRHVAPYFRPAVGVDASPGMIAAARSLETNIANPCQFENFSIEQLGLVNTDSAKLSGPPIFDGSVDLLTVASAVHWFDMAIFWSTAARLVKPGGSVALFANTSLVIDPALNKHIRSDSPVFQKIQAALDRIFDHLDNYMPRGNRLLHNLYRDLDLPWTLLNLDPAVASQFDEASFLRKEWTGILAKDGSLFQASTWLTLDGIESFIATISPYVRWREAHHDEAGGPNDPSKLVRKEIEEALTEHGIDLSGVLNLTFTGVLLMVKKKE